jgi:hypothetical protein
VNCFEAGGDFMQLARQLNINQSTARSIVRVWQQQGRIDKLPQGGVHA